MSLKGHKGFIESLGCSHDNKRIVSGSSDKTIKTWDLETGINILTLQCSSHTINSVSFSFDD
jgi:WD40 repeat protein